MKRLVALLIVAIMVVGFIPTANAAGGPGSGGKTLDHIDVRVAGSLTITSKLNGAVIKTETIAVTVSNVSATLNGTAVNTFYKKDGTGDENEWRCDGLSLNPKTDTVIVTFTIQGTKSDGTTVNLTLTKTYTGETVLNALIEECPADNGYDIDIKVEDLTETFTVDKTVTKVWDDVGNQDGIRPTSIDVQLCADGAPYGKAVTLSDANGWTASYTDLPKYSSGTNEVVYTVQEVAVPIGYTASYDGLTITNSHVPEKTSVKVTKNWDDNENQDGKRPTSIQVQLYADGTAKGEPVTLNEAIDWSYTWTELDKNKAGGTAINYTVDEVEVPTDYGKAITGSAADGYLVTNSYTPETTKVEGTKTWVDDNNRDNVRPDSVTIKLMDGEDVVGTAVVTAENGWKYSFEGLDKFRAGEEIKYTIVEEEVPGYTASYDGYNVTNTHDPMKTRIPVTKVWDDAENQDGKRPDAVKVMLMVGDKEIASAELSEANDWSHTFYDLYMLEDGEYIVYSVVEENVPGYKATYAFDQMGVCTITNKYTPETINISGTKTWDDADDQDGLRPEKIQVNLLADGVKVGTATVMPDAKGNWNYSFENQPKYRDGGVEIVYTITEEAVKGYTATVNGFNVTNTHTPDVTDITVTKVWEDEDNLEGFRPDSVTVILLAGGEEAGTIDLSEENYWTYTFENLPEKAAGKDIVYTVEELKVENYEVAITGSEEDGYTITNSREVEYVDIVVEKVWDDDNNRDGIRPESVSVNVFANGFGAENTIEELSEKNSWTHTYTMPKYAGGKEVKYTVAEEVVPEGYKPEVTGSIAEGFTITNTHIPATTSITVNKVWNDNDDQDDMREKVTVRLYSNDQPTEYTLTLTDKENSSGTFEDLFVYENKEPVVYTVVEENVPEGYTAEIVESENGFTITNTHEVKKTEISVEKVWDDADDQDGIRPDSITIKLLANGDAIDEKVLNDENDWTHTFTDLDVNAAGKEIKYSVEEVKVEGYDAKIQEADNGFVITNSHTPETIDEIKVTKVWDDADNQDGIRPEKVTVNLLADGEIVASAELKATLRTIFTGDWTASFKDMPKYANGKEIEYTITENAVSGYETEITGSVAEGFTVTNTHEPEMTKLDVQKYWDDENDKYETRAEKVKITLYANGKSTGKTVTLNEKNQWFDSFENLPKYDNGKEIKYTVKEASLDLYKASYSYSGTKAVVTNTLSEVPNTGDTSNVGLYLSLMGICAVAVVALIIVGKKRKA